MIKNARGKRRQERNEAGKTREKNRIYEGEGRRDRVIKERKKRIRIEVRV